jgi:hypothetical protein
MWKISVSPARFADENLASLSLECPTNLQSPDELGLLVALWCGRARDIVRVGNRRIPFNFGFYAGEILVEPTGAYIKNEGRLSVEVGRLKIVQSESDRSSKAGKLAGGASFDLSKLLGFGKISAEFGGVLDKVASRTEQVDGEYYQTYWRVADAGFNSWRVFGLGLNAENILEYKIIGDVPICFISPNEDETEIEVNISFRCDLRDLWVESEETKTLSTNLPAEIEQENRNRAAVAARVIARALNRHTAMVDLKSSEGLVVLARQKMRGAREMDDGAHNG